MTRGRRQLLLIVEALTPLGLNASPVQVAQALAPLVLTKDRYAFRFCSSTLRTILDDAKHQAIINQVIHDGMKEHGYESNYRDFYPTYCKAAATAGFPPFSLKTFQNRALQKQLWWERHGAAPRTKATHEDLLPASGE